MTIKQQGGIFGRNPTFNDVDIEGTLTVNGEPISDFGTMAQQDANAVAITGGSASLSGLTVDTNTLHVDATNNAAIIGTTTWNTTYEPRFQIQNTAGDGTGGILVSSYKPSVTFFDFSGGTPAVHRIAADSGKLSFEIDTAQNGTFTEAFGVTAAGNIAMANGKGIDFSATSGTGTSELFDDYEEGMWTPSYTASGLSVTHDNQTGSYTKIGNTVFFTLFIGTDAVSGGGAAQLSISGLPYAGSGTSSGIVGLAYGFNTSENDTKWAISNGSTSIALYNGSSNSAGVLSSSALATFSNTNRLYVSGTYQTA